MLAEEGTLLLRTAQLIPGDDSGRPVSLYLRPNIDVANVAAKTRILTLCYAILLVYERGYRLHDLDHDNDLLECRHKVNVGEKPLVLVIDNPKYPPEKTFERQRMINSRAVQLSAIAAAIAAEPVRFARLRVLGPALTVVDIGCWKSTYKRK